MAILKASLPNRGEPKVIQRGRLVLVRSMESRSNNVKREATDPPKPCPVIISWVLELDISLEI